MRMITSFTLCAVLLVAGCKSTITAQGTPFDSARLDRSSDWQFSRRTANSPGFRAVYRAAIRHGVDPGFALTIARVESGGRCDVRSRKGARGVMQVLPSTAKMHGVSARQLSTCEGSATAGVLELKRLHKMFDGDKRLIAIGYNAGPGAVKWRKLPRETHNYLKKVKR